MTIAITLKPLERSEEKSAPGRRGVVVVAPRASGLPPPLLGLPDLDPSLPLAMPRPTRATVLPHELEEDETEGDGMHPIADPRQTT